MCMTGAHVNAQNKCVMVLQATHVNVHLYFRGAQCPYNPTTSRRQPMLITLNIDDRGYTSKPEHEAGIISDRVRQQTATVAIDPADLMDYIRQGYTFTPAQIGGDINEWKPRGADGRRHAATNEATGKRYQTRDFWISQQIIVADIDNTKEVMREDGTKSKEPINKPLTPADALEICKAHGIDPFMIYDTFSSTDTLPRFRVLLVLNKPLTDINATDGYIKRFAQIFNKATEPELCADRSIEPVKLIFGGRADCIIYQGQSITDTELLEALPMAEDADKRAEMPQNDAGANNKQADNSKRLQAHTGAYMSLQMQLRADINNFDLANYVETTTASRSNGAHYNPCPICMHDDCLEITGALYRCYSDNHPKTASGKIGGSIIDYLMQADNLTHGQALDKFKFDIMHYDREQWQDAWKQEQSTGKSTEQWHEDDWSSLLAEAEKQTGGAMPQAENAQQVQETITEATANNSHEIRYPAILMSAADYLQSGSYDADIDYMKQFAGRHMGLHPDIDKHLTLYPGLAVLGGQASLGKTTFAVNMVSKLLERGEHVLYFAFEQTAAEIMSKSIAAHIFAKNDATKLTNNDVKSGNRCTEIAEAIAELAEHAGNYHLIECNFETTAEDVIGTIGAYMQEHRGIKPIAIIDYLQLIAMPDNFRGTMRDHMDATLKRFKGYQKDNGLFMVAISSFNRSSYLEPVSYESFKETGMIEATCDYVWGLQLSVIDTEDYFTETGAKGGKVSRADWSKKEMQQAEQMQMPKRVQLVSLKNRGGRQTYKANFLYYPQHDYFEPETDANNSMSTGAVNWQDIKKAFNN